MPGPPPSPLRRLNRDEYDHTVRDLLGDQTRPARAFPPDAVALGFDNNADTQDVSTTVAQAWADAAERLAANADLTKLLPCEPAKVGARACAEQFVETFGRRAFRRPLTPEEQERFGALLDAADPGADFEGAVRMVIEASLQSPQFLYRLEFGIGDRVEGERVPLDGHEIASRLSYLLWSSMPDEVLFEAAARGELATPEGIEAQARRMLADDRARESIRRFGLQWLGLHDFNRVTKDPSVVPDFDAINPLLLEEAALFVEHGMLEGSATRLFNGRETWLNERLTEYYGLIPVQGDEMQRYRTDRTARIGVLTLGAVLAKYAKRDQSSPILRGRFIRERLLCHLLPDPPGNVILELPPPTSSTTRDRFAAHSANPACSGCHALLEPVGFGLEQFDAAGRYRGLENGKPVDASGELTATRDVDGKYNGAVELSEKLAGSRQVMDCLALHAFRYGLGRAESELPVDACALKTVREKFAESRYDVRELLVALTQTDSFRYRGTR